MMDTDKTKKQLLDEMAELRQHVIELGAAGAERKRAEEEHDRFINLSNNLICIAGMDGYFKFVSPAWEKILGYSKEELLSKPFLTFIHPEDHHKNDAEVAKLAAGVSSVDFENRYIHKDGSVRFILWTATPIPEEKVIYCIGKDITERRRAEEEEVKALEKLKASEVCREFYIKATGQVDWTTNAQGEVEEDIPLWRAYTGQSTKDIRGWGWLEAIHPEDAERTTGNWQKAVQTKSNYETEFRVRGKDGKYRWFLTKAAPLFDDDGEIREWMGTCIDIHDMRQVTEALRESEERLRLALAAADMGTWRWVPATNQDTRDGSFNRILGLDPVESTQPVEDFVERAHPDDRGTVQEDIQTAARERKPYEAEFRIVRPDGEVRWLYDRGIGNYDDKGEMTHMTGAVVDITERKRAEEIIKHSALELEIRNRIAEVFLTIPDEDMYSEVLSIILEAMESKHGVFGYLDEKGDLVVPTMTRTVWKKCQVPDKSILFPRESWGDTSWSHAIREKRTICLNEPSTRIPEGHIAIERHISMPLIHQGEVMGLIQVANKKTAYTPENIALLETIGGAIAPVLDARLERERQETARKRAEDELRKHRDHLEELVQERTRELEEAQEELVRKGKLAVLGQLAGGVSHELRNPLGAIKNAAYLINMVIEHPEPEVKESLEMINREVAKSDRIITSILDYARPKPPAVQAVNVNQLLGDALSPGIVPDNIETVIRLDESLPLVMADPEQMARVFSNLILNAVQAMPEGGRLTVSSAAADDKVAVSVEDSGAGIPKENLDKIFEPLFSTRAKGIGLGLAIARDMMERNGGNIEVHSEEGKGSTFTVKLPLAGEQG